MLERLTKFSFQQPKAKSGDVYCPYAFAADSSNHLAFATEQWNINESVPDGNLVLASYTADSEGNLTTKSTASTMPAITNGCQTSCGTFLSISPSGKLVAVASGSGFQVFHFDGAEPITQFTGVLHSSEIFLEFGWDKSNHLYALSQNAVHIYTATSTSIKEVAGSPISIPEASSLIVQDLD